MPYYIWDILPRRGRGQKIVTFFLNSTSSPLLNWLPIRLKSNSSKTADVGESGECTESKLLLIDWG